MTKAEIKQLIRKHVIVHDYQGGFPAVYGVEAAIRAALRRDRRQRASKTVHRIVAPSIRPDLCQVS
jgi:hypothetical protein